ncbi:hypothetical protein FRC15_010664 [Serendipita sp. 397]|nr:hypothetical protein FRC15_010664 [Serendipita sp. 397]
MRRLTASSIDLVEIAAPNASVPLSSADARLGVETTWLASTRTTVTALPSPTPATTPLILAFSTTVTTLVRSPKRSATARRRRRHGEIKDNEGHVRCLYLSLLLSLSLSLSLSFQVKMPLHSFIPSLSSFIYLVYQVSPLWNTITLLSFRMLTNLYRLELLCSFF